MDALQTQGASALTGPLPPCYQYSHAEPYRDSGLRLRSGLVNFQPVVAGERLSAPGTPALLAPHEGVLLCPKYPPPGTPLHAVPVAPQGLEPRLDACRACGEATLAVKPDSISTDTLGPIASFPYVDRWRHCAYPTRSTGLEIKAETELRQT